MPQALPLPQPLLCAMPAAELPSHRDPQRDPLPFLLPFPLPSSTVGLQEIHRREIRELSRAWSSFFDRPQVRGWLRLSGRNGSGDGSRTGIAADCAAGIRCSTIVAAEQAASATSQWAPQDEAFAFALAFARHGIFRHGTPTVCWPHRQVVTARSASITRRAKAECESGARKRLAKAARKNGSQKRLAKAARKNGSQKRLAKAARESGVQKRRVTTTCARGVRRRRVQTVCTRCPRRGQAAGMSCFFRLSVGVQTPRAQVARADGACRWRAAMACSDGVQRRRSRSARDYRPAKLRVISLGWVSRSCGHGKYGAGRTQRAGLTGSPSVSSACEAARQETAMREPWGSGVDDRDDVRSVLPVRGLEVVAVFPLLCRGRSAALQRRDLCQRRTGGSGRFFCSRRHDCFSGSLWLRSAWLLNEGRQHPASALVVALLFPASGLCTSIDRSWLLAGSVTTPVFVDNAGMRRANAGHPCRRRGDSGSRACKVAAWLGCGSVLAVAVRGASDGTDRCDSGAHAVCADH